MGDLRQHVIGVDELVPTLSGPMMPYVNLDNAATAPAMRSAMDAVEALLPNYSSVHRGTGHKSRWCTDAYEQARRAVGDFVGADPDLDTVVFTRNTTEAINKLARSTPLSDNEVVITTMLEHHSNDLPWRVRVRTGHARARPDGTLDLDDLDAHLPITPGGSPCWSCRGRRTSPASRRRSIISPVWSTMSAGASSSTPPQLVPHCPIDMRPHDDPAHLDFVALSAHKLYAPFGSGAIVGRRDGFGVAPDHRGGGTVNAVTLDQIAWAELPDREEAGTPNVISTVAFAAAATALAGIGWPRIADHEHDLLDNVLAGLAKISRVRVHGPNDALSTVGVVPFTVAGMDHGLVAAILGYEHGIGVRSGCFCAHPYIAHLLGLGAEATEQWLERVRHGDKRHAPGMVRISFGFYNDATDVERVLDALERIVAGDIAGTYTCDDHGEYLPCVPTAVDSEASRHI